MFVVKLGMVSNLTLNIQVSNCHVLSSAAEPGPPIYQTQDGASCSTLFTRCTKKTSGWLTRILKTN